MNDKIYETLIIGAGFGGLGMAYALKSARRNNFLLLEKAAELGGTWRDNHYPGAECDVPSVAYSYSYEDNPDWDYKWSKQSQILRYMQDFAERHGLMEHMRFETNVIEATFIQDRAIWCVLTNKGEFKCRFLVTAVGQLHHPKTPNIPGIREFEGAAFHSASWDHEVQLENKNIGVIGSAASAVQLIPELAKVANRLTVYQRSPNWLMEKGDRAYSRFDKWLARNVPVVRRIARWAILKQGEWVLFPTIKGSRIRSFLLRAKCKSDMKKWIKDPALRKKLTPNFPIGAKRVLFSDTYYAALAQENVELVDDGVEAINRSGVTSGNGAIRDHDVLVFATGFYTNPFLKGVDITGRDAEKLSDHWANGAFAYNGVTTAKFPNLFFIYGPNTNTGHSSIIVKQEIQIDYILQLIDACGTGAIEVKEDVESEFDQEMQSRLSKLAWARVDASWYKVGDKVPNNWPGTVREFRKRLRSPNMEHFVIT